MSCRQFQSVLDELGRGARPVGPTEERALRHAEGCPACSEYLDEGRALTSALSRLADAEQNLGASPGVEAALRASFRAERKRPRVVPQGPVLVGLAAAAAVVFAALVRTPPRPAPSLGTRSAAFLPLPSSDPWDETEAGEVIRMNLDVDSLRSMGWPVNDEPSGVVLADVLVGEDGIARAVRFLE